MGDISTVLWYRGLLQSLCCTGTLRDWGREVGGVSERGRLVGILKTRRRNNEILCGFMKLLAD